MSEIHSICVALSDLLHLAQYPLGPSLSLQMAEFRFLMAELYSIVCMYHPSFILSSTDGHLGCFHILAIINNAA